MEALGGNACYTCILDSREGLKRCLEVEKMREWAVNTSSWLLKTRIEFKSCICANISFQTIQHKCVLVSLHRD